jgi:hypothetical protein
MVKRIIVNLTWEGIHSWPDCPFEDVKFLKYPHRHIFHICAKKSVSHNDRDIEIIRLKRSIHSYLQERIGNNLGRTSCEDLAERILKKFNLDYCSVLEDGENGAEIYV